MEYPEQRQSVVSNDGHVDGGGFYNLILRRWGLRGSENGFHV